MVIPEWPSVSMAGRRRVEGVGWIHALQRVDVRAWENERDAHRDGSLAGCGDAGRVTNSMSWDEVLAGFGGDLRDQAATLPERFRRLGADDPEEWALSQILTGAPQLARFVFMRCLWRDAVNAWDRPGAVENIPAAARLLEAGADRDDLVRLARASAYEAVFTALSRIHDGPDPADRTDGPWDVEGWQLVEARCDGEQGDSVLAGLNEDFQSMDPSGREGRDLWQ
jgi:hypothetical protein